jgi:outer membrane protein assembly factor BamD (BamD/ComL family)
MIQRCLTIAASSLYCAVLLCGAADAQPLPNPDPSSAASGSLEQVQNLHLATVEAWEKGDWPLVRKSAQELLRTYGETPFAKEALFHLGAAHYQLYQELQALEVLDRYLLQGAPRHFEEALEIKLAIAERFAQGRWKPLFGVSSLPRVVPADEDALRILDEILAAVPSHPLAARALLAKGNLLRADREVRGATEAFQQVIRKFPRDPLAQEAFVQLAALYSELSATHFHDSNLLDLAEINLAKFERAFPGTERLQEAQRHLAAMKERYAQGYLETASFYRRISRLGASAFYYACVLRQYPDTAAVPEAIHQLQRLRKQTDLNSDILTVLEEAEQRQGKLQST